MDVGIVLDGRRSAPEVAELAQRAEAAGLAHVWLGGGARTKDHFVRLTLAAAATRRIQIGAIAVSPFEMHPAQLASSLLTLDEVARGRAALVLGSGGDLAAALAAPRRGRVEATAEALDIIRALAAGGEIRYAGVHYRVDGLVSPWANVAMDRVYLAANRPRMLTLAATKADGVMTSDTPLACLDGRVARVRAGLAAAGRAGAPFRLSNWFVWNVQESRAEAERLARRQLGFRLYYIRDVAAAIGVDDEDARELARRQPEMVRAIFRGEAPWTPPAPLADRLIEHLTLTADRRGVDACVERLEAFARGGLTEVALAPHGDPAAAIALIGSAVVPRVQRGAQHTQ
ncbi:MAG: LLM class flavin-dependent oxidoreductase [Candidatus Rokubacteria bacterium]|nr:LLM class flavin-dependent oxidoreductase [Candidatus Rokubacteria bacterium]